MRPEILLKLVNRFGQQTARRTLIIAEFLQRNGSVRISPDMKRFTRCGFGHLLTRSGENMRALDLIEGDAAGNREQANQDNNDERQIAPHLTGRANEKVQCRHCLVNFGDMPGNASLIDKIPSRSALLTSEFG